MTDREKRLRSDSPKQPEDSEPDSEDGTFDDDSDDWRNREHETPRKKKLFKCEARGCGAKRIEPWIILCQDHWKCVPSIIRVMYQLKLDRTAEKQTDEFKDIARAAIRFANQGVKQPPYNKE